MLPDKRDDAATVGVGDAALEYALDDDTNNINNHNIDGASEWANFGGDGPFVPVKKKRSSSATTSRHHRSRREGSQDKSSSGRTRSRSNSRTRTSTTSTHWMKAPITTDSATTPMAPPPPTTTTAATMAAMTVLAPPSTTTATLSRTKSPETGSAVSKARWTTTVPVQSLRSPEAKLAARKKFRSTANSNATSSSRRSSNSSKFTIRGVASRSPRTTKTMTASASNTTTLKASSSSAEKEALEDPKEFLARDSRHLSPTKGTLSMSASNSADSHDGAGDGRRRSSKTAKAAERSKNDTVARHPSRGRTKTTTTTTTSHRDRRRSSSASHGEQRIFVATSTAGSGEVGSGSGSVKEAAAKLERRSSGSRSVAEERRKSSRARSVGGEHKRTSTTTSSSTEADRTKKKSSRSSSSGGLPSKSSSSGSRSRSKNRERSKSETIAASEDADIGDEPYHSSSGDLSAMIKAARAKKPRSSSRTTESRDESGTAAVASRRGSHGGGDDGASREEPSGEPSSSGSSSNTLEQQQRKQDRKTRRKRGETDESRELTPLERKLSRDGSDSGRRERSTSRTARTAPDQQRKESRGRSVSNKQTSGKRASSSSERKGRGRTPTPVPGSAGGTRGRSLSSQGRSTRSLSQTSRGRPSSQSRPPLTKENSRPRNRTRSASLTRVSNLPVSPSAKTARVRGPPPSTYRTLREMRDATSPMCQTRTRSEGDNQSEQSLTDVNIGRDITFDSADADSTNEQNLNNTSTCSKSKGGLMAKLFGDHVNKPIPNRVAGSLGYEIRPRILLAATVYHNTATSLWITTINTNQRGVAKNPAKANKFLKAFSFPTEREARESAIANAPPKMVPFNESPACFMCKGMFAVFRRAGHCRNCGVCVCSSCSTTWPAQNLPATYNLKHEAQLRVCRSCNSLSASFKRALVDGDLEEAIALYSTGNVNLRTSFAASNKKDDLMYPVHCAAEGGNLNILRWLIDDHFCPIKIHHGETGKKQKRGGVADSPILTSKGRSVLSIALENAKVDIMRYLVVECGISIYECTSLKNSLAALEAALIALPNSISQLTVTRPETPSAARWDQASFDDNFSEPSSLGADDYYYDAENMTVCSRSSRRSRASSRGDSCIICFDRKINCVATPCGHQVCCLECSTNLTICPVCNDRTNFIKIFRP